MKKLLSSLLLLVVPFHFAIASKVVPNSFLKTNETNEVNLLDSKVVEFGKYVDGIFSYQEEVLSNANLDSNSSSFVGGWKISGYKTDLAISKSGVFGVGALKATAATELTWAKRQNRFTQDDDSLDEAPIVIKLNEEMTEEDMRAEIEPVISMAINSGKVKNEKKLRKNLFKKTRKMHFLMRDIFNNGDYHWEIEKFRLNVSFGVSGNIFKVAKLGGDFRVRLEWYRVGKTNAVASRAVKNKKLNKLVNKLIKEVSLAAEDYESTFPTYKLDKVSIGIGASKKGVWGIGKSKLSSSGVLFLKRKKNAPSSLISRQVIADSDTTELMMIDNEGQNFASAGKIYKVPAKKFRKGLKKAFKVSKWLSKKASKRAGKWYIKKFKVIFGLSYKGIFGLSTTSGSSTAEIYFKQ